MTQIITRCFESAEQALLVRNEFLYRRRFSLTIMRLFDDATGLSKALKAAHVDPKTAAEYEKRVAAGAAVLLVMASYRPLGVAKTTRDVTAEMGALDLGGLVEEVTVKDERSPMSSIMRDHPRMLTRQRDPLTPTYHMADWPIPLISRRKPFTEMLFPPHSRMASFPVPLISRRKPYNEVAIPRHGRMAKFPIPLLSDRKPYTESMIPRHGRMANFPIPLISQRKPWTQSLIPRHQRMANWPFPHLIDGETGTNSLIPGGPRMANFPIALISDRKPFDGSIVPRHGRMANFPIPLLSQRKPYDETMFPRHARMADRILPLVLKDGEKSWRGDGKRFSLSGWLGLPTLLER